MEDCIAPHRAEKEVRIFHLIERSILVGYQADEDVILLIRVARRLEEVCKENATLLLVDLRAFLFPGWSLRRSAVSRLGLNEGELLKLFAYFQRPGLETAALLTPTLQ